MRQHDAPNCIVSALLGHNLTEADYYLYGAGRAIAFLRMAADALENLGNEQKAAEYHAYVGVSAARTAIDAAANWLRIHLQMDKKYVRSPHLVDFAKTSFLRDLISSNPNIGPYAQQLAQLAGVVDPQRQRAQHREGLALRHYPGKGWHLTRGLQTARAQDEHCSTLFRGWADLIENHMCGIIETLPYPQPQQ